MTLFIIITTEEKDENKKTNENHQSFAIDYD